MTVNIKSSEILDKTNDIKVFEMVQTMEQLDLIEDNKKKTMYKVQVLKDKQILKAYVYDKVLWKYLIYWTMEVENLV